MAEEGTRIGLTAFVQFARQPSNTGSGSELIVVNRVYEGIGWLSGRHCTGTEADAVVLRDRIKDWLQSSYAPAEPVDVSLSGHCNDLQAHPLLTNRILAWPGEPIRSDRTNVLLAKDLLLSLASGTGLFEILDRDGQLVAPVYFGSVLPVPTWGPAYALTVLAQPTHILRPLLDGRVEENAHVAFCPRRTHGRVVLTRAQWSVRTSSLLRILLQSRGFRRLAGMAEFCTVHAIPRVFFAQAQRWVDPLRSDSPINARKPTFIDTAHPFCLDLLLRLARDTDTVVITEVLPTHEYARQLGARGQHVTEVQVEMCISASTCAREHLIELTL